MTTNTIFLMMGQEEGGSPIESLVLMGSLFLIAYLFFIRPQIKKQKKAESFREGIKKGNKVVTIGGIHGKVETVKEKTVIITTEGGGKLKIDKAAISASGADDMAVQAKK